MHFQHFEDKRKDKRKFLRLKIITNRQFNFITAIRHDSTVTDLANRALNAYLQLSHQNKTKKQLTVSAVKQGRYFMPKSQIVSNLLSQDQEVEIMIVKAKPKFPEQIMPSQHDFEVLAKQLKNFDVSVSKRPSSTSLKIPNPKDLKVIKNNESSDKKMVQNESSSSSEQSQYQIDSKSNSRGSQLQHKKRERKRQRKHNKRQRKLTQINANNLNNTVIHQEQHIHKKQQNQPIKEIRQSQPNLLTVKYQSQVYQTQANPIVSNQMTKTNETKTYQEKKLSSVQEDDSIDIDLMSLVTFNEIKNFTPDKTHPTIPNSAQKNFNQDQVPKFSGQVIPKNQDTIVEKSIEKKEKELSSNTKIPQTLLNQQKKRDFIPPPKSQTSQQKLEEPKKKLKLDPLIKYQTDQVSISRKGSVDNRSQKTPKVNPIPSPKVVFHFETKHESPKVIYIPESRTMTEMKENIEKEKEKMKTMSPLLLPKSSPKITMLQDPLEKIPERSRGMTNSLSKKSKEQQAINDKRESMDEQKVQQVRKQKQHQKAERLQSSPKLPSQGSLSIANQSSVDERRQSSSITSTLSSDDRKYSSSVDERKSSTEERKNSLVDEKKPSAMQPEIIEEESSQEDNYITINPSSSKMVNNRTQSKQSQLSVTSNISQSQSDQSTIKKKSSTSSKFHEIESMIRKFKLEQSSDEERSVQMEAE